MMFFEVEQRSLVSAAAFPSHDAPVPGPDPRKNPIPVIVHISKRGGGEVPAEHATVIAIAATIVIAQTQPALNPAALVGRRNSGSWAQQGRALVHASHNVAHRPMQARSVGWSRKALEPAVFGERSAK
jgi:hypothetical protein